MVGFVLRVKRAYGKSDMATRHSRDLPFHLRVTFAIFSSESFREILAKDSKMKSDDERQSILLE